MKQYPKSIQDCIRELRMLAINIDYCEFESLFTWSAAYLKDYAENNKLNLDNTYPFEDVYKEMIK